MRTSLAILSAVCLATGANNALAQASAADTYEAHLARATALAGDEYRPMLRQCTRFVTQQRAQIADLRPEPTKVFDNLYRLGFEDVQAWAIQTSDGIILIDALNNARDAEVTIDPGLRRLGLDPAQIKYIVVTHGHGDHYGGAAWLVERYKSRVLMSEEDWKLFDRPPAAPSPNFSPPPKRDMVITDGQRLTLGDTTIELRLTPGHTLGTVSVVFPVQDGGRSRMAAIWGGTGFNFAPTVERFEMYANSAAAFKAYTRQRGVDVMLSNHAENDRATEKIAALNARRPGGPNPFVVGAASTDRFLSVLETCARANRARLIAAR